MKIEEKIAEKLMVEAKKVATKNFDVGVFDLGDKVTIKINNKKGNTNLELTYNTKGEVVTLKK